MKLPFSSCAPVFIQGRRVVEVLIGSKINYSMLKGLFGNEDSASRCSLVTVATELLLLSGGVEGALNTLRGNTFQHWAQEEATTAPHALCHNSTGGDA